MSFYIKENKNGFIFNNKEYKWGDGLLNLVNCDFTDLKNLQLDEVQDTEDTYDDYLSKFIKYDNNSIHYELLKSVLNNYINFVDEQIDNGYYLEQEIEDTDTLHNNMWWFLYPLFVCQNKVRNILTYLDLSNEDFKDLTIEERLYKLYKKDPSSLDFNFNIKNNEFYRYETTIGFKLNFDKNGNIYTNQNFYTIQDFVNYEIQKVINNSTKIIKCNYCGKYCIVNDIREKFCSKSCKNKRTNEKLKTNLLYIEYQKRYKYIYNKYYGKSKKYKPTDAPLNLLKDLYEKYTNTYGKNVDNKILEKFKKELSLLS